MDMITMVNDNKRELTNKKLINATITVNRLTNNIRENSFRIAKTIATVSENKLYEADGYKTVHEWTQEQFGYKKSLSYSLLRIGTEETMEILDEKGRAIDYVSRLHDINGDHFSVTQLERMSSLKKEDREELVNNGTITADMSCSAILKTAKSFRENYVTADSEGYEETPETFSILIKGSRSKAFTVISDLNEEDMSSLHMYIVNTFNDNKEINNEEE